ncbi:EndoU domain-containing protein [uncultured Sneathiella sp.]|mgnify:FL=1|uniref:EndoU domain-containing protein n=1 Tax=uncultured Sneathiella sp. TaxID=879315 RepID=UPI0030DA16CB
MGRASGRKPVRKLSPLKKAGLFIVLLAALAAYLALSPQFSDQPPDTATTTAASLDIPHIFEGEINRRGKPVGFHVAPRSGRDGHSHIKERLSGPNRAGVYTATVEIYDPAEKRWKEKFSSFFPDKLTKEEIIDSILLAVSTNELPDGARWRGRSGHDFLIEGYRSPNGNINTAYPLYVAD